MSEEAAAARGRAFFDDIWKRGDHWALETSPFEHAKYERELALLSDRRYQRVLEIGCGAGVFTRMLATLADGVLAVDVSPVAIDRARAAGAASGVDFRAADVMEMDLTAEGPWDLVVINETIYYLGWLYSFFAVAWLAEQLYAVSRPGGRLLMANTFGDAAGYLLRPPLIRTYRDLLVNVGYNVEREEVFTGDKEGTPLQVLVSLYARPGSTS